MFSIQLSIGPNEEAYFNSNVDNCCRSYRGNWSHTESI